MTMHEAEKHFSVSSPDDAVSVWLRETGPMP